MIFVPDKVSLKFYNKILKNEGQLINTVNKYVHFSVIQIIVY